MPARFIIRLEFACNDADVTPASLAHAIERAIENDNPALTLIAASAKRKQTKTERLHVGSLPANYDECSADSCWCKQPKEAK